MNKEKWLGHGVANNNVRFDFHNMVVGVEVGAVDSVVFWDICTKNTWIQYNHGTTPHQGRGQVDGYCIIQ